MPWDGTELWSVNWPKLGKSLNARSVAAAKVRIDLQPEWSPAVFFILSRPKRLVEPLSFECWRIESLCEKEAEFAAPQGCSGCLPTRRIGAPHHLYYAIEATGNWESGHNVSQAEPIDVQYTGDTQPAHRAWSRVFGGGSPTESMSTVCVDLERRKASVLEGRARLMLTRAIYRSRDKSSFQRSTV